MYLILNDPDYEFENIGIHNIIKTFVPINEQMH